MELHSQARGDRRVRPLDGAHIPDRGVVDRITGLLLRTLKGSPSPRSEDSRPCRIGLPSPRMPFTTGMIAAREDGGSSLAIPGAALRLGA